MKCLHSTTMQSTIALTITLISLCPAHAKKRDNPGGGGGSQQDAAYTVVDLGEHQSQAWALTEPDGGGAVLVSGMTWLPGPEPIFWVVADDGSFSSAYPGLPPGAREASINDMNEAGTVTVRTQGAGGGWYLRIGGGYEQVPFPGSYAGALTINNLGDIGGEADFTFVGGGWEGALWLCEDGEYLDPIPLGPFQPRDMTDSGLMVGFGYNELADRTEAAVAWLDENGVLQGEFLGILPGTERSEAVAVSNNGEWIVGSCDSIDFIWSSETGMIPLPTFGGYHNAALDVNNSGQVVGWADTRGGFSQTAVLWENGVPMDLNDLAETGHKPHLVWATSINDAGHITGLTRTSRGNSDQHGFILIPNSP